MKKIISMLLIVCLLGVLASGCGSNKQTVDSIKESGKLIIHTNAGFAPYEYPSNGKVVGVDMDIAKAIADKLGVELVIEDVKFDTIITSVQSGKAALGVAGITVTEERKESVDFSITYATSVQYIIVPAAAEVDTIEDLAGLKIGVQLGTTGNFIIDDEINGIDEEDGAEEEESSFSFMPVGHGMQDIPAILAACEDAGAEWVVVEQDNPEEGETRINSVRLSREYLKTLSW